VRREAANRVTIDCLVSETVWCSWCPSYIAPSSARAELGNIITSALPVATVLTHPRGCVCAALPLEDQRWRFKRCAVVGNSGVLSGGGHGPAIDAHDAVFRNNMAPVEVRERERWRKREMEKEREREKEKERDGERERERRRKIGSAFSAHPLRVSQVRGRKSAEREDGGQGFEEHVGGRTTFDLINLQHSKAFTPHVRAGGQV
jgi:hypothetical protein